MLEFFKGAKFSYKGESNKDIHWSWTTLMMEIKSDIKIVFKAIYLFVFFP